MSGRHAGVLIGLAAVFAYLAVTEPVFLTWGNWENIFRSQAVVFTLGIGMTFVVLSGGIDLSVASATVASGMIVGLGIQHGWAWPVAGLAGIAVAVLMGFVNGVLIGQARIPFFVVTLGTLSIYQSIALLTTSGRTISLFGAAGFRPVGRLVNGSIGPFPTVLVIGLAVYLVAAGVLHLTAFGRSVYAVGSNAEAARLSGIRVPLVLLAVYTLAGLFAGLAGFVQVGRLSAAGPQTDPNLMLDVVAAVLIGGTAFTGGDGGLFGTAIGVLFLGVIQNALQLSGVSAFWQGTVSGVILVVAVGIGVARHYGWVTRLRRRRSARRALPQMRSASELP